MTLMGVCTALGWACQTGGFLFSTFSPSTLPFGFVVVAFCWAAKTMTAIVQMYTACKDKPSDDLKDWNYYTYGIANIVENVLILCWVLDYARYCDWGECGNGTSDFGGDLFFYYAIGFGLPVKLALNLLFGWNMNVYYKEGDSDEQLVGEDGAETNGFLSKRGITLVVIN